MDARRIALALAVALSASVGGASAQRRRVTPPPPPPPITMESAVIEWNVFVASFHDTAARRTVVPGEVTEIALAPDAGWTCSVGAPTRARIDDTNWSEVRSLTCTHGDAVVSTNGFCQIAGASWGARAGILSLGTAASADRAQVTLDCAVR
jgi:hypothetical protein